jgi:hypothetical protein
LSSKAFIFLALFAPICLAQQQIPRWLVEMPVEPGRYLAIGECGNYTDKTAASREARHLGAFRLAAAMSVSIRYGLAATQDAGFADEFSFGEIIIDTTLMERLEETLVVLDSVQLEDGLHLLVAADEKPIIPDRYLERICPEPGIPDWVRNPPIEAVAIFGLGTSFKFGTYGWEDAERLARLAVAQQVAIKVKTGNWNRQTPVGGDHESLSNHTLNLTLKNSQVVRRAKDRDGVAYVLIRMPTFASTH